MELSVLKKMLIGGAKKILDNKQQLNEMNVFPIPDGDTGTNMDKTMGGVLQALAEIGDRDLESADFDKLYTGALMNSQGNSGVILQLPGRKNSASACPNSVLMRLRLSTI